MKTYVQEESRRENTKKWFVCILINNTRVITVKINSLKPMPSPGPIHGEREPFHTPTCHLELDWQGIRAACDISKTKMSQPGGSGVRMVTCITVCFNWLHTLFLFLSKLTFDMTKVALQKVDICHGCWEEKVASVHLTRANRSSRSRGERPPHCEPCNKTYRQKLLANNNDRVFQIEHPVRKLMLTFIARSLTCPHHGSQNSIGFRPGTPLAKATDNAAHTTPQTMFLNGIY